MDGENNFIYFICKLFPISLWQSPYDIAFFKEFMSSKPKKEASLSNNNSLNIGISEQIKGLL